MSLKSIYYSFRSIVSQDTNQKTFYDMMGEIDQTAQQEDRVMKSPNVSSDEILQWIQRTVNTYGHLKYSCNVQFGDAAVHEVYKIPLFKDNILHLLHEKKRDVHLHTTSKESIEIERYTIDVGQLTFVVKTESLPFQRGAKVILRSLPEKQAIFMVRSLETYATLNNTSIMTENDTEPQKPLSCPSMPIAINNQHIAEQLAEAFSRVIEQYRNLWGVMI